MMKTENEEYNAVLLYIRKVERMTRLWLLFGILALTGGQTIYPDQYEMMTINNSRASLSADFQSLQTTSSSQPPVQINQQFGAAARPAEGQFYPAPTRVPLYPSVNSITNQQSVQETWSNHVNNIISRGITKFALDLDRAIHKTSVTNRRENVVFSPISVSIALLLVLLGSAGKTFDEVSRVLGLETGVDISQHSEIVHQMYGQLLAIMNYRVEGSNMPRVSSASGIFVQQGYPIRPEFRAISENAYNSEVINLDFRTKGREARDTINTWVKKRTMDKIDTILNEPPDPLTTVIFLSTLYFKGEWNQHFLELMTSRKPFFIEPNDTVEIDMMYKRGDFPFYEDKSLDVKIVGLPYKGLENAERNTKSRSRRQSRPIDENFLRFIRSQNFPFYGLDNLRNGGSLVNPGLYANDVLHKVEMDVTEKGTEAATTTTFWLQRKNYNQNRLVANRPFMFFIRHNPTKLILFWGTINVPTPNYAVVR
ncbi:PREDICTED: leukocyte elastase inhibitor-like [Wasmannia auropunctata]|uniref:leukocyte elastase inhibitor-like n=1 Tax=Wasmannia auropunctata TaxID=64793 RepID=UPI0005F045B7|nr:PREDICTED: leukocyte elastase inhibitor-like [Wasmannia auropunctata]